MLVVLLGCTNGPDTTVPKPVFEYDASLDKAGVKIGKWEQHGRELATTATLRPDAKGRVPYGALSVTCFDKAGVKLTGAMLTHEAIKPGETVRVTLSPPIDGPTPVKYVVRVDGF